MVFYTSENVWKMIFIVKSFFPPFILYPNWMKDRFRLSWIIKFEVFSIFNGCFWHCPRLSVAVWRGCFIRISLGLMLFHALTIVDLPKNFILMQPIQNSTKSGEIIKIIFSISTVREYFYDVFSHYTYKC